eukprot:scaffold87602_cov54-Phaeocystis_antarctica.AAC.3
MHAATACAVGVCRAVPRLPRRRSASSFEQGRSRGTIPDRHIPPARGVGPRLVPLAAVRRAHCPVGGVSLSRAASMCRSAFAFRDDRLG